MINWMTMVAGAVFCLWQLGYVAIAAMQVQPLQPPQTYRLPATTDLRVILLGTADGPPVRLDQFGASTLIEAGGTRLLFDSGRGVTFRLAQMNIPLGSINRLFLTHLHSDHIIQVPDLLLQGWAGRSSTPLEVWGPEGTRAMMDALLQAFAFDIRMRRAVNGYPAEGIRVLSQDITEGTVFDRDGLKVTAFQVDHGVVSPAFGYRIDYRDHSVVLSGDTRVSANLVRHATGVDVLVHEAFDAEAARANAPAAALHATPEHVGEIFSRVKPRLAVYSHARATTSVIDQTRRTYSGPLQGAEDLLTIDIGAEIVVRHFGQ